MTPWTDAELLDRTVVALATACVEHRGQDHVDALVSELARRPSTGTGRDVRPEVWRAVWLRVVEVAERMREARSAPEVTG